MWFFLHRHDTTTPFNCDNKLNVYYLTDYYYQLALIISNKFPNPNTEKYPNAIMLLYSDVFIVQIQYLNNCEICGLFPTIFAHLFIVYKNNVIEVVTNMKSEILSICFSS